MNSYQTGDRVEIHRPKSPRALETELEWVPGTVRAMDGERPVVLSDDGLLYDSCDPKHVRHEDSETACPECGAETYEDTLYVLGQRERVCRNPSCRWSTVIETWGAS